MEERSENICQRECKALGAMCCGFFLVPCCMAVIFWNENDAVVNYATSNLVYSAQEAAGCIPTHSGNQNLVFAACNTYAPDLAPRLPPTLKPFLPTFNGSELDWKPEVLQYVESSHDDCHTDKKGTRHCVTTYSCRLSWEYENVDSSSFHCFERGRNEGHTLPLNLNIPGSAVADERSVILSSASGPSGGFALDFNMQGQLPEVDLNSRLSHGPGQTQIWQRRGGQLLPQHLRIDNGYLSTASGTPELGDVRVSLKGRWSAQATFAAQQISDSPYAYLGPYASQRFGWFGKRTKPLEKLEPGKLSIDEFVKTWNGEISAQTWLVRLVAVIVMIIAFEMIFQPLATASDALRFLDYCTCCLGSILSEAAQCMIHTLAAIMALCVALATIALAWIIARPGLGLALLAVVAAIAVCFWMHARKKASARQMASADTAGLVEAAIPPWRGSGPAVAHLVQPAQTVSSNQMNVTCPPGVGPGGLVSIQTPDGRQFQVAVPEGVSPGQTFLVRLQA